MNRATTRPDAEAPCARRRRTRAALVLAVLALGLASPAPAEEDLEGSLRESVRRLAEERHYSDSVLESEAVEELVAEGVRRRAEGASEREVLRRADRELQRAFFAFAPVGARPAPRARYRLPFDPMVPRFVVQGPGGERSHHGSEHHAVDFLMPDGTEVRAARGGVVARVVDGFTEGGIAERFKGTGNKVVVLHDDGTFAGYVHLSPGIPVEEGERVKPGERLGHSGRTGYTSGPHLHFAVYRRAADGSRESIPVRFGRGRRRIAPKPGAWMGAPPRPTIDVAISVDGEPVSPDAYHPVRWGERVRVRVETRPRGGRPGRDVTEDPALELVSMTPWSARVKGADEVVLEPVEGFEDRIENPSNATVAVFFVNRAEGEVGLGKIEFEIRHAETDPAGASGG